MDLESSPLLGDPLKCCGCSCCSSWNRSLKRKFDQINGSRDVSADSSVARVEIENECVALRDTLSSQQQTMQELCTELEEERNASESAANEAMSMILRLQREKAEVQMEARQFKRFADEKMAHDQQELLMLEDMLYKREQVIHSLTCEIQAYKHRLLSFGYTEAEVEGMDFGAGLGSHISSQSMGENHEIQFDYPPFDYPPLKCNPNETHVLPDVGNGAPSDLDKYASGETPQARDYLQNLEYRIYQLEKTPKSNQTAGDFSTTKNFLEKASVGQSPQGPMHTRRFSTESSNSLLGMAKETDQDCSNETPRVFCVGSARAKKMEGFSNMEDCSFSKEVDNASDVGDDMSDRVYTIDSVQGVPCNGEAKINIGICNDYITTPRGSLARVEMGETDVKKLYMRLQALEADRESMRHEIISMRNDKAQLILLKEMSQLLCKKMSPEKQVAVKKPPLFWHFSFMSLLKWVVSFAFWRKKAHRSKYMFEASSRNLGLLLLLDKSPAMMRQWRCLTRASFT